MTKEELRDYILLRNNLTSGDFSNNIYNQIANDFSSLSEEDLLLILGTVEAQIVYLNQQQNAFPIEPTNPFLFPRDFRFFNLGDVYNYGSSAGYMRGYDDGYAYALESGGGGTGGGNGGDTGGGSNAGDENSNPDTLSFNPDNLNGNLTMIPDSAVVLVNGFGEMPLTVQRSYLKSLAYCSYAVFFDLVGENGMKITVSQSEIMGFPKEKEDQEKSA